MKQKDIALIIAFAFIGAIISFASARLIFAKPSSREQKVEVIDKLSSEFHPPDARFFNANSINPSSSATLQETNQTPFNPTSPQP